MNILAIETSCDESAIALLSCTGGLPNPQFEVLSSMVLSQAEKHAEFGGVYPNLAKREHSNNLVPILKETLAAAGLSGSTEPSNTDEIEKILEREPELLGQLMESLGELPKPNIEAIAVTNGPGLEPALWVGVNFAKALSLLWDAPIIPTNHMEGHVVSVIVHDEERRPTFPAVALLVSGGHTQLVHVTGWGEYEIVGETRDDAIGEAFDKVARMMDLGYPGGPIIGRLASEAREANIAAPITLPRPMQTTEDFDFSYSGLKTAALYAIREAELTDEFQKGISREFEDAAFDVILTKTKKALDDFGTNTLIVGGGVIGSPELRRRLAEIEGVDLFIPEMSLTGDNATMIGAAGYLKYLHSDNPTEFDFRADGNLRL